MYICMLTSFKHTAKYINVQKMKISQDPCQNQNPGEYKQKEEN